MANCVTCGTKCKQAGKHIVEDNCISWTASTAMTNGDFIRSLSDYDLAEWIAQVLTFHVRYVKVYDERCDKDCPLYYCCNDQPSDNIEDWLKQEMKTVAARSAERD